MTIINSTLFRKNLFTNLDNIVTYDEQLTVSTKKGNAVIVSESEYNSLIETVYIMSKPKLVKLIKEGEKEDIKNMKEYSKNEKW